MTFTLRDERLHNHLSSQYHQDYLNKWPSYAMFTPWLPLLSPIAPVKWEHEGQSGEDDIGSFCGVYLVARFASPPQGPADPFDPAIEYIGRTRTAGLGSRWRQFRAAAQGLGGHSGGNTFHERYSAVDPSELTRTWVAGMPVWFPADAQPTTSFRTGMLEGLLVDLVHTYRLANSLRPLLNKA